MNNLLENRVLNCSLADSTFLHWYELTNAELCMDLGDGI